jgi:hypothetical protein
MQFGDERVPDLVWEKVAPEPNSGCWIWTAALQSTGRGVVRMNDKTRYVSHVMHEATSGPISEALDLSCRCGTICCVNPAHYQRMTPRARNQERFSAPVKRCRQGHEYTPENTYIRHGGGRQCLACNASRQKLSEKAKRWRRDNALRQRLWQRFRLTMAQYEAMLTAQEHRCAICRLEFDGERKSTPSVDHCHATGRVRALLCMLCNNALGSLRDRQDLAIRAAEYLREHQEAR